MMTCLCFISGISFSAKQKPIAYGGGYVQSALPVIPVCQRHGLARVPPHGGMKNRNPVSLIDPGFRVKRGMTFFSF